VNPIRLEIQRRFSAPGQRNYYGITRGFAMALERAAKSYAYLALVRFHRPVVSQRDLGAFPRVRPLRPPIDVADIADIVATSRRPIDIYEINNRKASVSRRAAPRPSGFPIESRWNPLFLGFS